MERQKVNKFNRTYNLGDKVRVRFTPSVIEVCTVKAPATLLGGKGVITLKELPGSYPIDKVIY